MSEFSIFILFVLFFGLFAIANLRLRYKNLELLIKSWINFYQEEMNHIK